MNEKRLHRCCFTGHRPEKLHESEHIIQARLEKAIQQSIYDGFYVFISGMARGIDLYAADIVLKLRKSNSNIKLICASPFEGFEKRWPLEWQQRYKRIMNEADLIRYIEYKQSTSCGDYGSSGNNRGCAIWFFIAIIFLSIISSCH